MSLEQTLARIEAEIAAGDLGSARDRLHGLLVTFPDRLDLRERLGDVYWRLQQPAMAGRYWYLHEQSSPERAAAIERFARAFGNDPLQMLCALKFRGTLESIKDTLAQQKLLELRDRAKACHGCDYRFGAVGRERFRPCPQSLLGTTGGLGCTLLATGLAVLAIIGVITVIGWLVP